VKVVALGGGAQQAFEAPRPAALLIEDGHARSAALVILLRAWPREERADATDEAVDAVAVERHATARAGAVTLAAARRIVAARGSGGACKGKRVERPSAGA